MVLELLCLGVASLWAITYSRVNSPDYINEDDILNNILEQIGEPKEDTC